MADNWNNTLCEASPHDCYDGMIHVESCFGGAPIIMSAPHFYNGDPYLANAVDGLKPIKELHDTVLDIEPTLGIALNAHKKIQARTDVNKLYLPRSIILKDKQYKIESHQFVFFRSTCR